MSIYHWLTYTVLATPTAVMLTPVALMGWDALCERVGLR